MIAAHATTPAKSKPGTPPKPPRACKGCGAPERVNAIGYTTIGLMGYCATCINRAFTSITKENNHG